MQRRNNTRFNNNSVKARKRPRRAINSLRAQNGAGVSGRDMVRAVRKFTIFDPLKIENANTEYAYGLRSFNVNANGSPFSELLDDYSRLYEQYRIRRVIIRATPGKGFNNSMRMKTYMCARVDVDQQNDSALITNIKSLINSENSVLKTFIERGNVKLCDYQPQCRVNTTASLPILPNNLNWYPLNDYATHIWKGAIVAAFLPEPSLQAGVSVTLTAEVDVEFRGRVSNPILFTSEYINQTLTAPVPDMTGSLDELRTGLLTGTLFPMSGFENVHVGNIGTTTTAGQILNAHIRVQSTMIVYYISAYSQEDQTYAAMLVN